MKRLFIILSIILLINSYYANSQIEYSVDKWMEYVEELALETEVIGFDFDAVRSAARSAWEQALSAITVKAAIRTT